MQLNNEIEMEDYKMGFFKEFKDDFSQAVNELMPGEDALGENAEDDLVVNTLENVVDVESELSKIDGLLEQVANQRAALDTSVEAVQKKQEKKEIKKTFEKKAVKDNRAKEEEKEKKEKPVKAQEEKVMVENTTPVMPEFTSPASDEVSVITQGMIIKGDVISNGSLDIRGEIQGNVTCNGKLTVTGTISGNSNSAEFFADAARIDGEVISTGTVKIGLGSVVVGNVAATSAVVAGAIKGDIDVHGPVVVDTSAVVMGNIKSRSVQINNGAVIEGFCSQCYSDIDVKSLFESKGGK